MPTDPVTILVDDLRSFLDGRTALVARSSAAGVALLRGHRDRPVAELWLDHDLGGADTVWPVVEELERAAFERHPYDVGAIRVHSANPAGAARIVQALRRWGYAVTAVTAGPALGHLDGARAPVSRPRGPGPGAGPPGAVPR